MLVAGVASTKSVSVGGSLLLGGVSRRLLSTDMADSSLTPVTFAAFLHDAISERKTRKVDRCNRLPLLYCTSSELYSDFLCLPQLNRAVMSRSRGAKWIHCDQHPRDNDVSARLNCERIVLVPYFDQFHSVSRCLPLMPTFPDRQR